MDRRKVNHKPKFISKMKMDELKNNVVKAAQNKLNLHKRLGNKTHLSILEVAELLDIISGKAENAKIEPNALIGETNINLN